MALAAWLKIESATRARTDASVFWSISSFSSVVAAAEVPCWSRAMACPKSRPTRLSVGGLELGHFQPTKERIGANAGDFGGFLNVALGQQRSDRLFLLAPEFSAWWLHFPPNPTIGGSPVINADSACLFPRPE